MSDEERYKKEETKMKFSVEISGKKSKENSKKNIRTSGKKSVKNEQKEEEKKGKKEEKEGEKTTKKNEKNEKKLLFVLGGQGEILLKPKDEQNEEKQEKKEESEEKDGKEEKDEKGENESKKSEEKKEGKKEAVEDIIKKEDLKQKSSARAQDPAAATFTNFVKSTNLETKCVSGVTNLNHVVDLFPGTSFTSTVTLALQTMMTGSSTTEGAAAAVAVRVFRQTFSDLFLPNFFSRKSPAAWVSECYLWFWHVPSPDF